MVHDASNEPGAFGTWSVCSTEPGAFNGPSQLDEPALQWIPDAPVPGTVAQALRGAGHWDFGRPLDCDARDWWYRAELVARKPPPGDQVLLHMQGLATLAEVWINAQPILKSDNMFQAHAVEISALLRASNEIVICFRSLGAALVQRRPRPRWKTRLVKHQQLRWFRTTLLGRIPGWSPAVAPVGPWRAITLEQRHEKTITEIDVRPFVEGHTGVLEFSATLLLATDARVAATLLLSDTRHDLKIERASAGYRLSGRIVAANLPLWWPHTHGNPVMHTCKLEVSIDGRVVSVDVGRVGFKSTEVQNDNDDFQLLINDAVVFCRGACWTVNDIVSLSGTTGDLVHSLRLAQQAGMNMVRVGGTMVYEQEAFYRLCDELGILVWQDFMFANMDYPIDDESFRASVEVEVTQQLKRLRRHVCIAVYCGNSEVEQQAAMLGMPRELWRGPLFSTLLPELCRRWHPRIPYVPSTPSGGAMPFHVGTGLTHYFGVGAYLRPVAQVRRDNVRFTAECLGFSNVPEPDMVDRVFDAELPATHHPRWKERVPRDGGAGWDFEDVRDHYFKALFGLDPIRMRCFDTMRYLALSRVTTGELMGKVYSEWRSVNSRCGGALVWFLRDLWPGAGWGILDSDGVPKACYYYLRRVWQPQAVILTDEGLDGIQAHVINETDSPLSAVLELQLLQGGRVVITKARVDCQIPPRSKANFASDAMLDGFYDVSYAYRFGPPKHDVVVASLIGADSSIISESFHFSEPFQPVHRAVSGVVAVAEPLDDENFRLAITSETFLYAVRIDVKGFLPDDNYFNLLPGRRKTIVCRRLPDAPASIKGYVEALNITEAVRISVAT